MKAVFKYPVDLTDYFTINMPQGSEVLTVQMQGVVMQPYVWALVDTDNPPAPVHFRLAGTGHPIDDTIDKYVGTFQLQGGTLVFHLFTIR